MRRTLPIDGAMSSSARRTHPAGRIMSRFRAVSARATWWRPNRIWAGQRLVGCDSCLAGRHPVSAGVVLFGRSFGRTSSGAAWCSAGRRGRLPQLWLSATSAASARRAGAPLTAGVSDCREVLNLGRWLKTTRYQWFSPCRRRQGPASDGADPQGGGTLVGRRGRNPGRL